MDTPRDSEHPSPGHEQSEMHIRPLVLFGLGLLALAGVTLAAMGWMFDYFAARQARLDVPPSPLADPRQLPPEPRLQIISAQDLQQLRATEDALLHSYGWVDREAGIVRLPIDRAIQMLAERGLPAKSEQSAGGTMPERGAQP
jgi:hypothetical protein